MITIRRARPEDVQEIIALANHVFRSPSSGMAPTMGLQYPLFLSDRNAKNLFVAEDDGRIVAHNGIMPGTTLVNGHSISMYSMGSVCTHPDYRGQGIGTRILLTVLSSLGDEGVGLLTISGGRGLYTRNGAAHTAGRKRFTLTPDARCSDDETRSGLSSLFSVVYHEDSVPPIADEMAVLYQAEPVRYLRTTREFSILLKAGPGNESYPPQTVVAACRIGQCLAAYVAGYRQKEGRFRVVEYAGDRVAVGCLLHRMLSDQIVKEMSLDVPTYDRQLISYLEECGWIGDCGTYAPTFIVTNAHALWRQARPLIEERLCERDDVLSLDQLPVRVDDGEEFLHLLFDAHQRKKYGQPWDSVLPLPLPWVEGFNYI